MRYRPDDMEGRMIEIWHFGVLIDSPSGKTLTEVDKARAIAERLSAYCAKDSRNYLQFGETFGEAKVTGPCAQIVPVVVAYTGIFVLEADIRKRNQTMLEDMVSVWDTPAILGKAISDDNGTPMDLPGGPQVARDAGYTGIVPERTAIMRVKLIGEGRESRWIDFRGYSLLYALEEAEKSLKGSPSALDEKPGVGLMRMRMAGKRHQVEDIAARISIKKEKKVNRA